MQRASPVASLRHYTSPADAPTPLRRRRHAHAADSDDDALPQMTWSVAVSLHQRSFTQSLFGSETLLLCVFILRVRVGRVIMQQCRVANRQVICARVRRRRAETTTAVLRGSE